MHIRVMLMLLAIGALLAVGTMAVAQDGADPDDSGPLLEGEDTPAAGGAETPAEDGEGATPQPAKQPGKGKGFGGSEWWLPVMIGGFILLYIWMSRGKKKEQRRRKEMLEALKKGDKITTIGGIVGTVMNVKDDEVTMKVDETTNTRMTFARWAVRGVGDAAKAEKPEDADRK